MKTLSKYFGLLVVLLWCGLAQAQQSQQPGHEGHNHGPEQEHEVETPKTENLSAVREVARELICPCPSCGKQALDQCHTGCGDGQKYRDEVAALLEQGKTKDEIIVQFARNYGQQMLGNPLPEGSGKWASLVPYLAVLCGLIPLTLVARSFAKKPRRKVLASAKAPSPGDDERLKEALRDFDY